MSMSTVPAAQAMRPLPQTTVRQANSGVPFVAVARKASRIGFAHAGLAFGGAVTDPLPSAPGYMRLLFIKITATGGTGTVATYPADSALSVTNVIQSLQFKDGFGTTIFSGDGLTLGYLSPLVTGQYGLLKAADITTNPSYSAGANTGNFSAFMALPLEITTGYGCVSIGNASAMPTLQINLQPAASFYTVLPTTVPTIEVDTEIRYYEVDDPSVEPQGLGSTSQKIIQPANPLIGANASLRVQLPRTAGYVRSILLVLRDSTGARVDAWGSRCKLWVDGFLLRDQQLGQLEDEFVQISGNAITRPTGVLAYFFQNSLSQLNLGLADTLLEALPVAPGTQLEFSCEPWGAGGTAPYTLYACYDVIVPKGALVTGLPEVA